MNDVCWFVGFGNASHRWWWTRLLRKGFEHVNLYRFDGGETIVVCETIYGLRVEKFNATPLDFEENVMLSYVPEYSAKKRKPVSVSCVGVAKSILGIHSMLIFTPSQLHDYLLKHGAQIVKPYLMGGDYGRCYSSEETKN